MNVFHIVPAAAVRMQEPEPFDRERARSGLTCYHWTVPCASPGADRVKGPKGDFMTGFSLRTFGFPENPR